MISAEFETQFARLTAHFHLPSDDTRDTLTHDWFTALSHYHVEALDHAVTELIRTAQDRFWPPLGRVMVTIQTRFDKYQRTDGKCQTCHGSTWMDSAPFKSNGMIYENVMMRCLDCGIPAPSYSDPPHRHALTSREFAEWRLGDAPQNYMPECAQAKAGREGELTDMHAAMAQLGIRLFGSWKARGDVA